MHTIEFTYDLQDIDVIASRILEHLKCKKILFNGEMGAGKTTFINALIKAMGSTDMATSPTFSIVNEYTVPNDKIYHFDFYRIESIDEAYNFGIEDYLSSDNWLFMEWPERISDLLTDDVQTITLTSVDSKKRSLKLTINNKFLTENIAMTETKF